MKRVIINNNYKNEKTLTTEQYKDKLKQQKIDEEFDKLIEIQQQKQAKLQLQMEEQQNFKNLVTQLSDCEAELYISEQKYKEKLLDNDTLKSELDDIKNLINTLKIKYTKLINKLEQMV